uniref:Ladderlectin-like n=1 Tax=Mastacembelus armatus TaxID=205130 RepID=A0A3Q3LR21_9TELE
MFISWGLSLGEKRCPRGWTLSYGRCYIFVPTAMTWPDAEKNCQSLGGNLASVHHDIDYQVVQNVIYIVKGTGPAWIGGTNWRWTDGTPFNFSNWGIGQPDNYQGNENCLQISTEGKSPKCRRFWDDLNCQTPLPFVCAKKV